MTDSNSLFKSSISGTVFRISRYTKWRRDVFLSIALTSANFKSTSSLKPTADPLCEPTFKWLPTARIPSNNFTIVFEFFKSSPACRTRLISCVIDLIMVKLCSLKINDWILCSRRLMHIICRKYCSDVPRSSNAPSYFVIFSISVRSGTACTSVTKFSKVSFFETFISMKHCLICANGIRTPANWIEMFNVRFASSNETDFGFALLDFFIGTASCNANNFSSSSMFSLEIASSEFAFSQIVPSIACNFSQWSILTFFRAIFANFAAAAIAPIDIAGGIIGGTGIFRPAGGGGGAAFVFACTNPSGAFGGGGGGGAFGPFALAPPNGGGGGGGGATPFSPAFLKPGGAGGGGGGGEAFDDWFAATVFFSPPLCGGGGGGGGGGAELLLFSTLFLTPPGGGGGGGGGGGIGGGGADDDATNGDTEDSSFVFKESVVVVSFETTAFSVSFSGDFLGGGGGGAGGKEGFFRGGGEGAGGICKGRFTLLPLKFDVVSCGANVSSNRNFSCIFLMPSPPPTVLPPWVGDSSIEDSNWSVSISWTPSPTKFLCKFEPFEKPPVLISSSSALPDLSNPTSNKSAISPPFKFFLRTFSAFPWIAFASLPFKIVSISAWNDFKENFSPFDDSSPSKFSPSSASSLSSSSISSRSLNNSVNFPLLAICKRASSVSFDNGTSLANCDDPKFFGRIEASIIIEPSKFFGDDSFSTAS